ncbi:hypothetical protein [Gallibacterium anatis]|nr:hypothetical protein [Gallibacterium anatis]
MEYFLQGEDKLGFELNKYEYDYAKFLLSQQNKATEEPIEVTGKEFGEFDTSTKEGKKLLREEVFKYLTNLADIKEKVYCRELKAEVGFTKSGAKKFKKFGADILKLKLAAKIKQIIALGKKFKPSHDSYDPKEKQYGIVYHYLKTPVKIDGIEYGARVVIREDNNGKLHYDLQVKDSVNAILDSVNTNTVGSNEVNKAPVPHRINSISAVDDDNRSNDEEMQAILDGTQENNANGDGESKYVLNLFVEYRDENGNWVELKDEEDKPEIDTTQIKDNQAEQEDKSVDNSANQQEQQDRAFLEKTIAGDFDALSDEFEQQITEIAERYDGQENEMEALVMQAVDVFVAKLDELSA